MFGKKPPLLLAFIAGCNLHRLNCVVQCNQSRRGAADVEQQYEPTKSRKKQARQQCSQHLSIPSARKYALDEIHAIGGHAV